MKIFKTLAIITLIVGLLAVIYVLVQKNTKNEKLYFDETVKQRVQYLKINDSVIVLTQKLYVSENRMNLVPKTDSLIREALKAAKIQPSSIAMWKNIYSGGERTIEMRDSFNSRFLEILEQQKKVIASITETERAITKQKYDSQLDNLLSTRVSFAENTKYRKLKGNVGLDSKINIIEDSVISEPFVVFGEKKKFLNIGKPSYSVVIGDRNPSIVQITPYSSTFVPKQKGQISVGPMILTNGKNFTGGAGVNYKKGIFSFSLGYTLYNSK